MSGVLHGIVAALKTAAAATDSFFKYVTLLLHGDGTNGAQNNTFLDGSTNAFTITRNGNTTQGTFSPFSQTGWSNFFDGTGDYLTVPSSSALEPGSGNFTIELWYYPTRTPSIADFCVYRPNASAYSNFSVSYRSTGKIEAYFSLSNSASVPTAINSIDSLTNNAWNHIAFVKNGLTYTLYINGVANGTHTAASNPPTGLSTLSYISDNTYPCSGYISNVRIVKDVVYTAAFTPPTAPLTNITNTSLLTCQSNRFIDNSSNAFAITRNGDVRVEAFSPFNPSTTYSTANVGGSGYFDGTGDYLTAPDNAAFAFGTGDFTLECWMYFTGSATNFWTFDFRTSISQAVPALYGTATSATYYVSGVSQITGTISSVRNNWAHLAVARSGTSTKLFVNGIQVGSTWTDTTNYIQAAFKFGRNENGAVHTGEAYFSSIRVVKGTAVYTANFTPPTSPLTAITNTQLLLLTTNGGIFDNAAQTVLETVGNAQVSTTEKKYGTGSMYFDGTGDWLIAPDRPPLRFGTADFTVEGWVYLSATGAARGLISKGTSTTGWAVDVTSGNKLQLSYTSSVLTGTTSLVANTWYHFAVIRYGSNPGNVQVFLNGVLEVLAGTAITTDFNQTSVLYVGANRTGGDAMNGYIDDLRITNGYARYGFFTPPSTALTPTAYTAALPNTSTTNGAQNNTFLDDSTNNFTITRNGNTTQGTFSPFSNSGWSNYFDGTGDYLTSTGSANSAVGTGDFSIEAFVYYTSYPGTYTTIFSTKPSIFATATGYGMGVDSSGTIYNYSNAFITQSATGVFALNAWQHIVFTRSGTTARIFLNGVLRATGTNSQDFSNQAFSVGAHGNGAEPVAGYISNVRLVKGSIPTAYQTSSTTVGDVIFTPPTAPLTAITNTSLLTCQSNRFIDNSTNAFAITRNGDVSVQAFSPFTPAAYSSSTNGGSGYFDGTGDYLQLTKTGGLNGTGNFTVEFWYYPSATSGMVFNSRTSGLSSDGIDISTDLTTTTASVVFFAATTVRVNSWAHVAFVRNGTTLSRYVNGVLDGSTTSTQNFTGTTFMVGGSAHGNIGYFTGYISNFRVVDSAVYTAAFTPPTAPLTAITNTSLLCNFTNAGIFDAVGINNYETVGNAQASTTQAKFGTTSMYFDGTGDWLTAPDRQPQRVGSGNFTIEGWFYLGAVGTARGLVSKGTATTGWSVNVTSGNKLQFSHTSSNLTGNATLVASTWYHFAVVRSGTGANNVSLYLNGVLDTVSTSAITTDFNQTNILYIGANRTGGDAMNGYIDDVRITPGQALYNTNFTPPTAAFPDN